MTDLIDRNAALIIIGEEEQIAREEERDFISPTKKATARGKKIALRQIRESIEKLENVDPRRYDVATYTDHYRMIPCDEDVTCGACGYKRPRLRNERIYFCSVCGACIGAFTEG